MSLIEIIGAVFSLLSVYLAMKQNRWCWAISLVGLSAYMVWFWQNNLPFNALLQVVFIIQAVWGHIEWLKHANEVSKKTAIANYSNKKSLLIMFFILIISALICAIYPAASKLDVFTSVGSIVAQQLMVWRVLQNWWLWIIIDLAYLYLLALSNSAITFILYFIFLITAIISAFSWSKEYKKEQMLK